MLKLHADQLERAGLTKDIALNLLAMAMDLTQNHLRLPGEDMSESEFNAYAVGVFAGLCNLHGPISVHHSDIRHP